MNGWQHEDFVTQAAELLENKFGLGKDEALHYGGTIIDKLAPRIKAQARRDAANEIRFLWPTLTELEVAEWLENRADDMDPHE